MGLIQLFLIYFNLFCWVKLLLEFFNICLLAFIIGKTWKKTKGTIFLFLFKWLLLIYFWIFQKIWKTIDICLLCILFQTVSLIGHKIIINLRNFKINYKYMWLIIININNWLIICDEKNVSRLLCGRKTMIGLTILL